MQQHRRKWKECQECHQLILAPENSQGNHRCPDAARAKKEAELDMVIDEELSTWDRDLKKFWKAKDVKFYEYLADHQEI